MNSRNSFSNAKRKLQFKSVKETSKERIMLVQNATDTFMEQEGLNYEREKKGLHFKEFAFQGSF